MNNATAILAVTAAAALLVTAAILIAMTRATQASRRLAAKLGRS